MKKQKSLIPYMIIGGLGLFMAYIFQFVYRSMGDDAHLVSKDYYQNEIAFQSHINKVERSFDMKKNTAISLNSSTIIIELPKTVSSAKGMILLYNPTNPDLDKKIPFNFTTNNPIQLSTENMKVGDWTIKIDFETEGKGYYIERPITI